MSLATEQALSALKGHKFEFPDFWTLYRGWPLGVSPYLPWIRDEVRKRLQFIASQREAVRDPIDVIGKLMEADLAFCVAAFWPNEPADTLLRMAYTVVWLALWCDEIDRDDGRLRNSLEQAQSYRSDTNHYVSSVLTFFSRAKFAPKRINVDTETGAARPDSDPATIKALRKDVLITSFHTIAESVRHYPPHRLTWIINEIKSYIDSTGLEQHDRLTGTTPSTYDYLKRRTAAGAIFVLMAVLRADPEFGSGDAHYRQLISDLTSLAHETNIQISLVNDIVSLPKDINSKALSSLVLVMYLSKECDSIDASVKKAVEMLRNSRRKFDQTEERLHRNCPPQKRAELDRYINVLKTMCTGNLAWSLNNKRYGIRLLPQDETLQKFIVTL